MAVTRSAATPCRINASRTASARRCESDRLNSAAPVLSVWPRTSILTSEYARSDSASLAKTSREAAVNSALQVQNPTPSRTRLSAIGLAKGQPFSSTVTLTPVSGHWS